MIFSIEELVIEKNNVEKREKGRKFEVF
jgi:hypothetical protein